ncbi:MULTISPECIES: glycoside hydrolase family 18 protein [unclassified Kitasatospora]|uniref:glycoside hydrolase family 18 protein n=1 Tax=unclassified Kitasatospora TaxID=2633591 RepID=UPI0024751C47|nr:glycoside hydrolase family 18 protein [Kitasatospora sp. MAP12-44]
MPAIRRTAVRRTAVRRAAATAAAATCAFALLGAAPAGAAPAHRDGGQKELTGYFTQWGIYSGFMEKNLISTGEINHLTELDYGFSDVTAGGLCGSGDSWADYQRPFSATESVDGQADQAGQALLGNFNQLRELKAKYPKLKIVMSIGGWSWSGRFSQLAATAAGRQNFVASCVDQYLKGDLPGLPAGAAAGIFDGFAVDWEYPGEPGNGNPYGPQDTPDYTALMQEFRQQETQAGQADGTHYLLTANTSANPAYAAKLELGKVAKVVDWFNVMTFDYHGGWEATGPTDLSSALFQDPRDPNPANDRYSVDQAVQYYEQQGVRPEQIGLAIPYYAHEWSGVAPGPNGDGLFQPAAAGVPGTPDYNQVVTAPGETYWDPLAAEPYKYDPAGGVFSTYDDPASVWIKGQYIRAKDLRGTFVWSMDGDTSDGSLTAALGESLNGH